MDFVKKLEELEIKDYDALCAWAAEHHVGVKTDPELDLAILSYDREESDLTDFAVRDCRGLIIERSTLRVVCYTFSKGYDMDNAEELRELKEIWEDEDAPTPTVERAIDGTQIRLFHYGGEWRVATTRCINAYRAYWNSSKSFGAMYDECEFDTSELVPDGSHCYGFVLCHPDNRIVIGYKTPMLYHVITRELDTLDNITDEPGTIGALRPERLTFKDLYELQEHLERETNMDSEGYVVRVGEMHWKGFFRRYLELKELRGNSHDMFYHYLQLRMDGKVGEFLYNFPEFRPEFDEYRRNMWGLAHYIHRVYIGYRVRKPVVQPPDFLRPILYQIHGEYLASEPRTPRQASDVLADLYGLHPAQVCAIYYKGLKLRKQTLRERRQAQLAQQQPEVGGGEVEATALAETETTDN